MEKITPIENLDEMIATDNFEGLTAAMLFVLYNIIL